MQCQKLKSSGDSHLNNSVRDNLFKKIFVPSGAMPFLTDGHFFCCVGFTDIVCNSIEHGSDLCAVVFSCSGIIFAKIDV